MNRIRLYYIDIKLVRDYQNVIINKAEKVYDIVTMTPDKNRRLVKRSVDFKKLEKILERKLQSLDKE